MQDPHTTLPLGSQHILMLRPQRQRLVDATGAEWVPATPLATNTAQSSIWIKAADFVSLPSRPDKEPATTRLDLA
jgi:hypothetical protein